MAETYHLRAVPAELSECVVKTSVLEEVPHINNHLIIMGKGVSNLYDLIRPLRAKYLGVCACVCVCACIYVDLEVSLVNHKIFFVVA